MTSMRELLFIIFGLVIVGWAFYVVGYCKGQGNQPFDTCFVERISFRLLDVRRLSGGQTVIPNYLR